MHKRTPRRSFVDIIEMWPSVASLSRVMDRPYTTVDSWRRRGRIPDDAWEDLIVAANQTFGPGRHGITSDALMLAAKLKSAETRRAAA